jgi:hypothetical protein
MNKKRTVAQEHDDSQAPQGQQCGQRAERVHRTFEGEHDPEEVRRHGGYLQTQKVLHLRQRDQHRNAVGKPNHHGNRDEANQGAEFEEAHGKQHDPRHGGGDDQIGQAIALQNAVDDDDERTRRPPNLDPAAAQDGNQKPRNDGREQPGLGLESAGNGKGHGQWQGNDAHGEAGSGIANELLAVIALDGVQQARPEKRLRGQLGGVCGHGAHGA